MKGNKFYVGGEVVACMQVIWTLISRVRRMLIMESFAFHSCDGVAAFLWLRWLHALGTYAVSPSHARSGNCELFHNSFRDWFAASLFI